jgi:hypothetical protein
MMFKWIKRLIVLFILLGVAAYFGVAKSVNSLVKTGVEKGGTHLMEVPVTLADATVSLTSGGGSLSGLRIPNPEGFKSESAITVGNAAISLKPGSLMSSKVVIHQLKVEQPAITYERTLSTSNLDKIMETIQSKVPESDENAEEARFQIDDLQILQASVKLSASALGGKGMQFTLPDIVLKDLGKDGPGLTAAELTKTIMGEVLSGVLGKVAGSGVGGIADALKGAFSQDGGATEDGAASKAEGMLNNVKSLFNTSKSDSSAE